MCERTIAEYKEELSRMKEDNKRLRQLLDAVFKKPQVVLHRTDVCEDYLHSDQQQWSFRMEYSLIPHFKEEEVDPLTPHVKEEEEDPLTPHIKEEEEEHSISQHVEGVEEVDVTKMPVTGVPVKSEGDEVKDIHQLIGHQEECLPHLQGDSFTLEDPQPSHFKGDKEDPQPPYFKEEEEGECVVGQEEDDVMTVVSVKTEEHEDKAHVQQVSAGSHEEEWHTSVGQKELQAPSHIKEEQLHDLR
ncbi:uncharacterized protein LOC133636348 isoform X2 [Entelurus aequoreus]|uniref:uncharacterized protein LOC133636348 isoform X2 n=1 Tax=Entelurus aequoreus TaxID=161455 RepID=UPI002B1D530B|nr:uncharacterized protein LOC133636348 isoform X2 [Entelurus aequoreus]